MDANDLEEATKLRAGVKNLAETKVEIAEIQAILEENIIDCRPKTGEIGTEESFMSLSSAGINILHLATHGFFWTNENENDYSNVHFLSLIQNTNRNESALLRSGLLLSGANIALQGKKVSNEIQDGILTAQEISSLDFEGMNLVVLSACETGLGDITSEGVFGLQRAFKIAGVQTIIMSLWKVDDEATQMFMTEFYNNWIAKKQSKREAFNNAQNTVRMKHKEPVYWAGFVMLD
jgi:CHAT domain-containing protein